MGGVGRKYPPGKHAYTDEWVPPWGAFNKTAFLSGYENMIRNAYAEGYGGMQSLVNSCMSQIVAGEKIWAPGFESCYALMDFDTEADPPWVGMEISEATYRIDLFPNNLEEDYKYLDSFEINLDWDITNPIPPLQIQGGLEGGFQTIAKGNPSWTFDPPGEYKLTLTFALRTNYATPLFPALADPGAGIVMDPGPFVTAEYPDVWTLEEYEEYYEYSRDEDALLQEASGDHPRISGPPFIITETE